MNLDELYSVHTKPKSKSNNLFKLYLVIAFVSIISFSFARFSVGGNVDIITNVAKFNISINDVQLNSENINFNGQIPIVIDDNEFSDGILRCGEKGHFDVKIDPSDTETNLYYKISIDKSNLPVGFLINEYSVNDFNTRFNLVNNAVQGDIDLGGKEKLDQSDIRIYRFYFEWNEDFCLDINNYSIIINSVVEQKISW